MRPTRSSSESVGEGNGLKIQGTMVPSGEIEVLSQEPNINFCPICLARNALIDK